MYSNITLYQILLFVKCHVQIVPQVISWESKGHKKYTEYRYINVLPNLQVFLFAAFLPTTI